MTKTIRVLFVIDGLAAGGAERSLAEMLPFLAAAGITPTVAFFHRHKEHLEELFRAQGADLRFLPARHAVGHITALRRLIQAEQPDVIHTTLFEADVFGRVASIGQRGVVITSLVTTPYDPIRGKNPDINLLKLWAARWIDTLTARCLTTHFHAVSESVRQAAIENMGLRPERISVIHRGRNPGFVPATGERRAAARESLGLQESDEVILNVGRHGYEKGQRYLMEAMELVLRRRPNSLLLIAGPRGRHTELLESIQRRAGLTERVRFLGQRSDVPDVLASADLFVFPSLYEGAAGALLEAMAAGLPIVASRIPSIAEVVREGHNALLVERSSVVPLADAIVELLADRTKAAAFGRRSRSLFEERFTLDISAEKMIAFYRGLTERGAPFVAGDSSVVGCR